jgi:hypothetical protein
MADQVIITQADVAEGVIRAVAPDQLDLLAAVTAEWDAGRAPGRRRWGWLGGSIGSGIEPAVLTDVIYPLLTGTFAQALGTAAISGWRRRRWWRRRGRRALSGPRAQVTLDVGQLDAVRAACVTHGMTLGLSKAKATVLADAMQGVLRQAADAVGEIPGRDTDSTGPR